MNQKTLIKDLKAIFDTWREEKKTRSVAELARRSGISYADVRRTIQGDIKPTFSNIAPLLNVMLTNPDSAHFYEKHFPSEYEVLKKMVLDHSSTPGAAINVKKIDDEYLKLFLDPYYFPILAFLSTLRKQSIDREVIRKCYGESGIAILNELVAKAIVKEDATGSITFANWYHSDDQKIALMMISEGARYMASNPRAYGFCNFAMVNRQALNKMFALAKEFEKQLEEIVHNDESAGDIPINSGILMGRVGLAP